MKSEGTRPAEYFGNIRITSFKKKFWIFISESFIVRVSSLYYRGGITLKDKIYYFVIWDVCVFFFIATARGGGFIVKSCICRYRGLGRLRNYSVGIEICKILNMIVLMNREVKSFLATYVYSCKKGVIWAIGMIGMTTVTTAAEHDNGFSFINISECLSAFSDKWGFGSNALSKLSDSTAFDTIAPSSSDVDKIH